MTERKEEIECAKANDKLKELKKQLSKSARKSLSKQEIIELKMELQATMFDTRKQEREESK